MDELAATKRALGWNPEQNFHVPDAARAHFLTGRARGGQRQKEWGARFRAWSAGHPELVAEWNRTLRGELPEGWDAGLPVFGADSAQATRQAGGKAMNAIAKRVPEVVGGDADLSVSTTTAIVEGGSFDGQSGAGRNLHFGVREHAMGAIVNGLAYHGGVRAYASTFFVFSDYMRPAVRLAALNRLPVIYIWTHDSIGVGEDGPTHQPIEHIMSLRAMPNLAVVRPADPNETVEAWHRAMLHRDGPVALIFSRQKVPVLDSGLSAAGVARGAYVAADADGGAPDAIIIGSGSEVHVALAARALLAQSGIRARVVSMPCWEWFESQAEAYRESVLPAAVRARVSVEAGVTLGWQRWVGENGISVGVDRFGASAPGEVNMREFGVTPERVAECVHKLVRGR